MCIPVHSSEDFLRDGHQFEVVHEELEMVIVVIDDGPPSVLEGGVEGNVVAPGSVGLDLAHVWHHCGQAEHDQTQQQEQLMCSHWEIKYWLLNETIPNQDTHEARLLDNYAMEAQTHFQPADFGEQSHVTEVQQNTFRFGHDSQSRLSVVYSNILNGPTEFWINITLPKDKKENTEKPVVPKECPPNNDPQVRLQDPRRHLSQEPQLSSMAPPPSTAEGSCWNTATVGALVIGAIKDQVKDIKQSYSGIVSSSSDSVLSLAGPPSEFLPSSAIEYIGSSICSTGLQLRVTVDKEGKVSIRDKQQHLKGLETQCPNNSRVFVGGLNSDVVVKIHQ